MQASLSPRAPTVTIRSLVATSALVALALGGAASGCSAADAPTYPLRSCSVVVWHKPKSAAAKVSVLTSASGWAAPGVALAVAVHRGWWRVELEARLRVEIKHDEDQVLFVDIGPADGRGRTSIEALGKPYAAEDRRAVVA